MSSAQEPAAQITNTLFPPPPDFYKQFTDENVARYEALKENEAGPSRSPRAGSPSRVELEAQEREELEGLRSSLQPPKADWIEEEGRWVTFGEMHTVRYIIRSFQRWTVRCIWSLGGTNWDSSYEMSAISKCRGAMAAKATNEGAKRCDS